MPPMLRTGRETPPVAADTAAASAASTGASAAAAGAVSGSKSRRRKGLLRRCRRSARKKWRQLGIAGVLVLLLATILLCVTAYVERWGERQERAKRLPAASTADPAAPVTQTPQFFSDKAIPALFQEYSDAHNKVTARPEEGRYLLYELPMQGTLPHSLLGLTSTFMLALLTGRALLVQWTEEYEAPGPADIGGGAGNWHAGVNATAADGASPSSKTRLDRRSSLEELFLDPGFWWGWERFQQRWVSQFGRELSEIRVKEVDVMKEYDSLVCGDLTRWLSRDRFVKVTNSEYFAPLLTANSRSSAALFSQVPSRQLFAYLSNWLLRPVPAVMTAVRRFTERYFDNNYVIGVEMSLFQSLSEWGTMPALQQQLFFQEATDATNRASQQLARDAAAGTSTATTTTTSNKSAARRKQSVVVLVVTDDEEVLRARLKGQAQDTLGAAGIIAITGPRGSGTRRILTELQEVSGIAITTVITSICGVGSALSTALYASSTAAANDHCAIV
jgi:hypothetical protein